MESLVRGILKEMDFEYSYEQALLDKHLNSVSFSERFKKRSLVEVS